HYFEPGSLAVWIENWEGGDELIFPAKLAIADGVKRLLTPSDDMFLFAFEFPMLPDKDHYDYIMTVYDSQDANYKTIKYTKEGKVLGYIVNVRSFPAICVFTEPKMRTIVFDLRYQIEIVDFIKGVPPKYYK
ncbi:MAG: hypothetical protein ABDI07_11430, partial [Candidatus Kryptonium sp.]